MPIVSKVPRYVTVAYELHCGYERATALADDLNKHLKDEKGFHSAKDDTRGWDGDRLAVVVCLFDSLEDANRLDATCRQMLGRSVNFTYEADVHTSYGGRGPESYVTSRTTLQERKKGGVSQPT